MPRRPCGRTGTSSVRESVSPGLAPMKTSASRGSWQVGPRRNRCSRSQLRECPQALRRRFEAVAAAILDRREAPAHTSGIERSHSEFSSTLAKSSNASRAECHSNLHFLFEKPTRARWSGRGNGLAPPGRVGGRSRVLGRAARGMVGPSGRIGLGSRLGTPTDLTARGSVRSQARGSSYRALRAQAPLDVARGAEVHLVGRRASERCQ